jgi:hypothetical protein
MTEEWGELNIIWLWCIPQAVFGLPMMSYIFLGLLHSKYIFLCYGTPQMSINTTILQAGIYVPYEKK